MHDWLQLTYHFTLESLEHLEERLAEMEAAAITIQDGENQPIFEPEPGTTPYWETIQLKALFQLTDKSKAMSQGQALDDNIRAVAELAYLPKPDIAVIEDEKWERRCIADFKPMCFGKRLWIVPSWSEIPEKAQAPLHLDPGLAFGTGSHATTSLCLEWLDSNIQSPINVIDYGCGSGILALAALALGAQSAWAVDIDPQAVEASMENAAKNNLSNKMHCLSVDAFSKLPSNDIKANLLVANILAKPLISLASIFAHQLKYKGMILLSGILANQVEAISQAYSKWFDQFTIKEKDGWARIAAHRKTEN